MIGMGAITGILALAGGRRVRCCESLGTGWPVPDSVRPIQRSQFHPFNHAPAPHPERRVITSTICTPHCASISSRAARRSSTSDVRGRRESGERCASCSAYPWRVPGCTSHTWRSRCADGGEDLAGPCWAQWQRAEIMTFTTLFFSLVGIDDLRRSARRRIHPPPPLQPHCVREHLLLEGQVGRAHREARGHRSQARRTPHARHAGAHGDRTRPRHRPPLPGVAQGRATRACRAARNRASSRRRRVEAAREHQRARRSARRVRARRRRAPRRIALRTGRRAHAPRARSRRNGSRRRCPRSRAFASICCGSRWAARPSSR